MKKFLLTNWALIFCLILIFVAIRPLLNSGFFTMHDDEQIARLYELGYSLLAGQFPVRWVSHLGFGFGYPLFNFYPPFVYYLGEIFHLTGFSLIDSTKIVMALGFLLSALFMFLWVKNRFGSLPGLVASVLYTYSPYHSVDLYVRGALSEFFSFVWIPAVFWSLDKLVKEKNIKWSIISGILISLVVITHNLIALSFLPFLITYIILCLFREKTDFKILFPLVMITAISSLGLSAFFWLPALSEKQLTLVDNILTKELANYKIHFVCIQQLWNSPWGYGGSAMGCSDGLSFQVGKINILASFLSLVFSIILLIKSRKRFTVVIEIILLFILFILSLYMTLEFSKPIWDLIKPLAYLQFPWRFLLFSAVFSSFLGGALIYLFSKIIKEKYAIFLLGVILISSRFFFSSNYFKPQTYLNVKDSNYTTNQDIEWRVSGMSFEYVPKGVATRLSKLSVTELAIDKKDLPKTSFKTLTRLLNIKEERNTPIYKSYKISGSGGKLVINTFVFPGWKAYVDNKNILINPYGKLKLISLDLPKGNHYIQIKFENTLIRTVGNSLSLISFFSIITLLLMSKFKKIKHEND